MPRYFSAIKSSLAQVLVLAIAPLAADPLVQQLGQRLGQPIGKRLGHDRVVIVVVRVETAAAKSSGPEPAVTRKGAEIIGAAQSTPGPRNRQATEEVWPSRSHCCRSSWKRAARSWRASRRYKQSCHRRRTVRRERNRRPRGRQQSSRATMWHARSLGNGLNRSRAAEPTFTSERICGYLPLSSQVMKNGDQSM